MAWHIVEKLIEQVGQHSTLVGKFWTTFFFVLRFLIVVSIADNVFEDEQEEFVCNTLTPGCQNICFNEFSPISLIRLWALQILAVAIPSVIFIVYTAHKLTKIDHAKKLQKKDNEKKKKELEKKKKQREKNRAQAWRGVVGLDPPDYSRIDENGKVESIEENIQIVKKEPTEEKKKDEGGDTPIVVATKLQDDNPPRLFLAYVAQVLFRLFVEISFLIAQQRIYVFNFFIPELFKCSRWPCPNTVDCFVSRPMEKTVLLWVMFGTGIVMIAVGLIELYHIGMGKILQAWKNRHEDITKKYKSAQNNMPQFGGRHHGRYRGGYPQAVGIRVGYARSSISGGDGGGYQMDQFI